MNLEVAQPRLRERLLHRSQAGPEREVVIWGHPACRRCAFVLGGSIAGFALGFVASAPFIGLLILVAPAGADALFEKWLARGHRPRRLAVTNLGAGLAFGLLVARVVHSYGAAAGLSALTVVRIVAWVAGPRRRRARARAAGARP